MTTLIITLSILAIPGALFGLGLLWWALTSLITAVASFWRVPTIKLTAEPAPVEPQVAHWQSRAARMEAEAARWQAKYAQVKGENNVLRRHLRRVRAVKATDTPPPEREVLVYDGDEWSLMYTTTGPEESNQWPARRVLHGITHWVLLPKVPSEPVSSSTS